MVKARLKQTFLQENFFAGCKGMVMDGPMCAFSPLRRSSAFFAFACMAQSQLWNRLSRWRGRPVVSGSVCMCAAVLQRVVSLTVVPPHT